MVLATFHAMKDDKKDPMSVLNSLSKNKLSIEHCKYIVDEKFIVNFTGFIDLQVIVHTLLKNAFHVLQIPAVRVICCQDHFTLFVAELVMRHFLIARYVKSGAVVTTFVKISFGARYVTQLQRDALELNLPQL